MGLENVKTCPKCDSLYMQQHANVDLCRDCYLEEEEHFRSVKTFINRSKNKTATLRDVVEETNVDSNKIVRWIKEGRLIVRHMENLTYDCESCQAPTKEGRLCSKCRTNFLDVLKSPEEKRKEQNNFATYITRR